MTNTDYNNFLVANNPKHQANPFFLIQKAEDTNVNYETILPIVFIISFLLLLFLIYLTNTYCLSSSKNSAEGSCCFFKSDHELPRSTIYSNNFNMNTLQNRNDANRRSTMSSNSYGYPEEPRIGYFNAHRSNYVGRACALNHNYDKIYDSHPSNLILAIQQRNLINQSENSTGYELPSIEESFPLCNHNENRQLNISDAPSEQIMHKNFILKSKPRADVMNQSNLYRELSVLRRSYSNSRLNNENWNRKISKQRPQANRTQNWPSQIMSEQQVVKFLGNQRKLCKLQSFQMLRAEGLLKIGSAQLNQHYLINKSHKNNEINNNNNVEYSKNGPGFNTTQSRRDPDRSFKIAESKPLTYSYSVATIIDETDSKTEASSDLSSTSKSYSGILASNREYSNYFENQEINLNKSELNLEKNESLNKFPIRRHESNKSYSSNDFKELRRIKKRSKKSPSQNLKQQRPSTFKVNMNESSNNKTQIFLTKESKLINKLSSKLKEKNNSHYVRLCKSFTFLSQKVNENPKETSPDRKHTTVFISEPYKLAAMPIPLRHQQSNYLKNLNAFKLKSGYLSTSSIYETVKSVTSLVTARNEKKMNQEERNKVVSDAAVQTSIISEGSSFNSQVTTLLQTNNYGSIIANFGSASVHQNAMNHKGIYRLRAYSEGNGLSDSMSSGDRSVGHKYKSISTLSYSASFSKAMYSKEETYI